MYMYGRTLVWWASGPRRNRAHDTDYPWILLYSPQRDNIPEPSRMPSKTIYDTNTQYELAKGLSKDASPDRKMPIRYIWIPG